MDSQESSPTLRSSKEREHLFLEMVSRTSGITAQDVYEEAMRRGDTVSPEAYFNLGRRLALRGVLRVIKADNRTSYSLSPAGKDQWLDEGDIEAILDPDYPLIALTILQESRRQTNQIPETVWAELRERLKGEKARDLFYNAIIFYCENLNVEVEHYIHEEKAKAFEALSQQRQIIENVIILLRGLTKFGLGLSKEAAAIPKNADLALKSRRSGGQSQEYYNPDQLRKEIENRVSSEMFFELIDDATPNANMLIAAVDGSTRGGLLSVSGEIGDFSVAGFPQVTINTAVAQINRDIRHHGRTVSAYMRLPEKPEDMQQRDNRHTIMAKMFYPDITDGEYVHLAWNAMDVLETRAAFRALSRWEAGLGKVEVNPADVVMRDGALAPQDRDFNHYRQQDSYGKVVRDLIDLNSELVHKISDGERTVSGIVKNANLKVFSPVINWYANRISVSSENTQIRTWPLQLMNHTTDQVMLSRLMTAQRKDKDAWLRTCLVLRPFHATTNFSEDYSIGDNGAPSVKILNRAAQLANENENLLSPEDAWLAGPEFQREKDPYIKLLNGCWYAGCYVASVARLDLDNVLPRIEFILPHSTASQTRLDWTLTNRHLERLIDALRLLRFEVASEHSMFRQIQKIDVLPSLIIRVHDTVKTWAGELVARTNEVIGHYIIRRVADCERRNVRIRPWTASELSNFGKQLQRERSMQAGKSTDASLLER